MGLVGRIGNGVPDGVVLHSVRMKPLTRILVSIVVGAILTLLTAWLATAIGGVFNPDNLKRSELPADWALDLVEGYEGASEVPGFGVERVWAAAQCESSEETSRKGWVLRIRAGWPMHALECWETPLDQVAESRYGGDLHRGIVAFTGDGEIYLPTRPRMLACLINTVFYGSITYMFLSWVGRRVPRCSACEGKAKTGSLPRRLGWSICVAVLGVVGSSWLLAVFSLGFPVSTGMLPVYEALGSKPAVEWTQAIFREHTRAPWRITPPPGWPDKGERNLVKALCAKGRFGSAARQADDRGSFIEWSAAGLPLCAMESRRIVTKGSAVPRVAFSSGVAVPRGRSVFYMPLRPMLLPFVFNTLVFAVAIFLILTALAGIRRWRRSRTGRCPSCAGAIVAAPAGSP